MAVGLLIAALIALATIALLCVPWDWVPAGELTPMPVNRLFTAEEITRAEQFSSYRRLVSWSGYAVSLVVAGTLGLTPLGARLSRRWGGGRRWWLTVASFTVLFLLVGRLATLPFSLLLRAQSVEYGLTTQSPLDWLVEEAKSLLVDWVMTTIVLVVIVGLARRYARRWFVAASGVSVLLVFGGSLLYPVLVEPLFNDFTSMPAGPVRRSVVELADRESVKVEDVLIADASRRTTTLNAYVSGLWGTRRVVVYDTLLENMPAAQRRVVIAHELAHAREHDVLIGTALGAAGSVAAMAILALLMDDRRLRRITWTRGPGDPAATALFLALFSVGSLLASPATNSVSRAIEMRADREALAVTTDDDAFIRMQRELALKAIQDPTPPALSQFWFGSHPTVLQRAGLPASLKAAR